MQESRMKPAWPAVEAIRKAELFTLPKSGTFHVALTRSALSRPKSTLCEFLSCRCRSRATRALVVGRASRGILAR